MIDNPGVAANLQQPVESVRQRVKISTKLFNVSERSVWLAMRVTKSGIPALEDAVAADVVSLSDAAAIACEPAERQEQALDAVKAGRAKTLRQALGLINRPDGFKRLLSAWKMASEAERAKFVKALQGCSK